MPPLLVLRHGETLWNRDGRLQGALDSPLTDKGRAQAGRQQQILHGFGVGGWHWYCSPQGRAATTAQIAQLGNGTQITRDDRLREIGLGEWAGRLRAELAAEHPHVFESDDLSWYHHAPDGEGIAALADRATHFLTSLRGPSVIVTHGITSRVLRCLALSVPYEAFGTLEGGQGIVYHIENRNSTRLE